MTGLASLERLARIVIMRWAELGLSQQEVARRMDHHIRYLPDRTVGSTPRASSASSDSVRRGRQAVNGFDFGTTKRPGREFVPL